MDFKKLWIVAIVLALTTACSPTDHGAEEDEDIIGKKVSSISDISMDSEEREQSSIALFDETTRKIHQFDLQNMKHIRALDVKNPQDEHFVLQDSNGEFVVDLTAKHISIYTNSGQAQHNPVQFVGEPISAAFRPDLGYIILYDDLMSVSILKVNAFGSVTKATVLGPILGDDTTIVSGDINDSGELILAMSDNTLAIVDLETTLNTGNWVYSSISTSFNDMKWISPVPGHPEQILIRSFQTMALMDVNTQTVLSELTLSDGDYRIKKYSKAIDPHIIFQEPVDSWSHGYGETQLAYVQDSQIKTRLMKQAHPYISISRLDLNRNTWTYVDVQKELTWNYNDLNHVRESRRMNQYRFSDLAAISSESLPDTARLKMAAHYIFALFPSELGYAQRIDISNNEIVELRLFNLRHIKK